MPTVTNGRAQVAYEVRGSGRGLLLVHGAGASGITTWGPLLPTLEASRTVVVPDLRGSGQTRDPGGPLALDAIVSDMLAVADDAGLEEFDVAGFSLGGFVAAGVALSAPERIASLVVIAAGIFGGDSRTRLQFELWRDLYNRDQDLFRRYWLLSGLSPEFVAAIPADELDRAATFRLAPGLGRQSILVTELDLRGQIRAIRAPTLVIGCKHDGVFPPALSRELAASFPAARYVELDSGHMVVLEAPQLLVRAMTEFLDGQVAAGFSSPDSSSPAHQSS
jgi:3-oxoadipate enol-lactonase